MQREGGLTSVGGTTIEVEAEFDRALSEQLVALAQLPVSPREPSPRTSQRRRPHGKGRMHLPVPMSMMQVGIVWMLVANRLMPMPV
jgi:hypothetical protein